jgi:glutamine---fructose-6-phosphate transaminase (isomerizing)
MAHPDSAPSSTIKSTNDSILHREIFEQPAAMRRALEQNRKPLQSLITRIQEADIRYIVLAARGTSDNAATYAKYLLQITCGIPVALAAPSVHTLYNATVNYKNALIIGVSQSGAGEDINEVMTQARKSGALTVAITNTESSNLARIAEHVLLCHAGEEKAVAATKTYTTTLAIFAQMAAIWSGNAEIQTALDSIENAATAALTAESQIEKVAGTLYHAERALTVARGLHLCTAIESALKIAETTYTTTQAFSSADLLHGPIASVAARTPCLLFSPAGASEHVMNELAEKLQSREARVIRLRENASESAGEIPLVSAGSELLSPLVDILPAQLLAYHLTVARGLNPDNPRGLTKVTITR